MSELFPGFEPRRIATSGAEIHCVVGGSGPPLLLLHGYPQTHAMWHRVAPRLAERFTVVCSDLRGYGDSAKPDGGAGHVNYSKRAMAADQVEVMRALGFAASGSPATIAARASRIGCASITRRRSSVWRCSTSRRRGSCSARTDQAFATAYYHWFFLIQPFDLPERLIGADPVYYLHKKLGGWSAGLEHLRSARARRIRALLQRSGDDPRDLRGLSRGGDDRSRARRGGRGRASRMPAARAVGHEGRRATGCSIRSPIGTASRATCAASRCRPGIFLPRRRRRRRSPSCWRFSRA